MIKRLYEADAAGLRDESLVDEVGFALYVRCERPKAFEIEALNHPGLAGDSIS